MPSGPSHFVDVYNVNYGAQAIYSVTNIKVHRKNQIITGEDNNKLRPVSSAKVRVSETISFETEDAAALIALVAASGAANLTFTWKAAGQTLTSGALANQSVTIKNVVITDADTDFMSKGLSKGTVQGIILETSDDTDPIVYA